MSNEAELLRVVGAMDEETTLAVYYQAYGHTFRARLAPGPEREVLTLTSITEVEFDETGGFVIPETETEYTDCIFYQVPPVVRRAVERPVQYPSAEVSYV